MSINLIILFVLFVSACTYFNYRSGYKKGVIEGAESTLQLLEATGYIKIVKDDIAGEDEIKKVKAIDVNEKP